MMWELDTHVMTIDSSAQVILMNLGFENSQQVHLVIYDSRKVQVGILQIVVPGDIPNTDRIHISAS